MLAGAADILAIGIHIHQALEFFARLRANASSAGRPPPLGLHIPMGETAPMKVRNMIENISENRVAPFELIAERPA